MFINFIKEKKSVSLPALLVIPLFRYMQSGYLINFIASFLFMLVCLYIWFVISKNKEVKTEEKVNEVVEERKDNQKVDNVWTKKRTSLDDRLGTIGLLILGVISTPFVDGFLYYIFLICGITGIARLIGKKRKELSNKQRKIAWVLAVIFILGTLFFKYLDMIAKAGY